jgi:hypothetical protein
MRLLLGMKLRVGFMKLKVCMYRLFRRGVVGGIVMTGRLVEFVRSMGI